MNNTKNSMFDLLEASGKQSTDFAGKGKPALENGVNALKANVDWGQETTN